MPCQNAPPAIHVVPTDLDAFVAYSDALGGPGSAACSEYWSQFSYSPEFQVDQELDPYSDDYVDAQLRLYREISGRDFNQAANELTQFDVARHVAAVNPYDHGEPSALAMHVERLSRAFRLAKLSRRAHLLDLGCGWGLSSEAAAYLGLRVTAVDINPLFVDLVNKRAKRSNLPINATVASFDDFSASDYYDMVLFYECLHHALKPWDVIAKFAGRLAPDGKIVLAGEPIQAIWWQHWGLRLDSLSIYCIRKFGWFESGWSLDFIRDVFQRVDMTAVVDHNSDSEIGYTLVATMRTTTKIAASEIAANWSISGWALDGPYLTFLGEGMLTARVPAGKTQLRLLLRNYRGAELSACIRSGQVTIFEGVLAPGDTSIDAPAVEDKICMTVTGETWCPAEELRTGDNRRISFHLVYAYFW